MRTWAMVPALVSALACSVVVAPSAEAATMTARSLAMSLPVRAEAGSATYLRTAFRHWVDADRDGCDTRAEVLRAESLVAVRYTSGCRVTSGRWRSPYDGAVWTLAGDVDIDHVVALKEAWESGARTWTAARRQAFANDLGFAGTLIAVTDNVNSSKSDRDPAQWLPPRVGHRCTYAINWVRVKHRWRLSIDAAERAALLHLLSGTCGQKVVSLPARAL